MLTPDPIAPPSAPRGDTTAVEQLAPLVYDELRRLAATHLRDERRNHTLDATALAHEAYLRLCDQAPAGFTGRAHFMALAAEMIRRILVDHARTRARLKRGGDRERIALPDVAGPEPASALDLLSLDEALTALAAISPRQARVVELKFFGGLEIMQIADAMGVSETLVKQEWRFARAWLAARMDGG